MLGEHPEMPARQGSAKSTSRRIPDHPARRASAQNPVDWWFALKFNTANFRGCKAGAVRACQFGGQHKKYYSGFSQQFVYASSENETLQEGIDCLGDTLTDPVGATFDVRYAPSSSAPATSRKLFTEVSRGVGSGAKGPSPQDTSHGAESAGNRREQSEPFRKRRRAGAHGSSSLRHGAFSAEKSAGFRIGHTFSFIEPGFR